MFLKKNSVRVLGDFVDRSLASGDCIAGTIIALNTPFGEHHEIIVTVAPKSLTEQIASDVRDVCVKELSRVATPLHSIRFTGLVTGLIAVIPEFDQPKRAYLKQVVGLTNETANHKLSPRAIVDDRLAELDRAFSNTLNDPNKKVIRALITSPIR